jgi:hypothetical protein
MVAPYLSRLRVAESGPGSRPAGSGPSLRPRPRSRFEPAPALPIDGPAGASLGLSPPPVRPDAELAEVEADRELDPPHQQPADTVVRPVTVGAQEFRPARAEVPPGQAAGPPSPPATRATPPADLGPRQHPPHQQPVAPTSPAVPPPPAASPPGPPPRLAGPPAPAGAQPAMAISQPGPAGDRPGPGRPGPARDLAPAPPIVATGAAPGLRHPAPDRVPAPGAGAGRPSTPPPPPAGRPPPAERPPRRADEAIQAAGAPADRVQAMARWLRDADPAQLRVGPAPPPGPHRASSGQAQPVPAAPDVTVTIGRIEVKIPAAEPGPARRTPSGPERRVPSLADYLESRTRVRGRPG